MEGFYIDVPFFLISLAAIAACAVVTLIVEAITRGNGGKVTYVFTFLVAFAGAFLSVHWEYLLGLSGLSIGDIAWDKALVGSFVPALIISAIGYSLGGGLYALCVLAFDTITTPVWKRGEGEAAIRAAQKETDVNTLDEMARDGASYEVRSIANEKLGRHQAAQFEVAFHSTDEAECLAVLDKVDWGDQEHLLVKLATTSPRESVALKAVEKVQDDEALAQIAVQAKNEAVVAKAAEAITDDEALAEVAAKVADVQVAANALARIGSADVLGKALGQMEYGETKASSFFEAGRDRGDVGLCAKALDVLLEANASGVVTALDTIHDAEFLKAVIVQWLDTAENPLKISQKLKGEALVMPAVAKGLEDYCCPNGHLHELKDTSYIMHADTDERIGVIRCKKCGYEYTVDEHVQRFGENCGYTFRPDSSREWLMVESKQVRCRPGGYRCASCREFVQPTDDGPAPCICPFCGAESHNWKHYDGEIIHRDYSSGASYDYCTRCGKKKNYVDHNTW